MVGMAGDYDHELFQSWRVGSLSMLQGLLSESHIYSTQFAELVSGPYKVCVGSGLGILRSLQNEIVNDQLTGVRGLIAAEILTDFVEMAEHLLEQGYHIPAASLAGAVLEEGLRRAVTERGLKATGNLESLNDICKVANIYSPMVYKQVKVWIDVRNSADHGLFAEVTNDLVFGFVRDLPGFIASNLANPAVTR